jgi:hypothetical protein
MAARKGSRKAVATPTPTPTLSISQLNQTSVQYWIDLLTKASLTSPTLHQLLPSVIIGIISEVLIDASQYLLLQYECVSQCHVCIIAGLVI